MNNWNPNYKSLDHWRGFAALWVMMFHGFRASYDKPLYPLVEIIRFISQPGWLGVHIFFVVSGYCITASAYKSIIKQQTPLNFIKNRFLRLFPVYWSAFLLTIIINLISSPFNKTNIWDNFPSTWQSWLGNIFLIQPYLDTPVYVVVYWSLVVEFAFYIVVTILLLMAKNINYRTAVFSGVLLAFVSAFIIIDRVLFIQFWCEFFCGVLLFTSLLCHHCKKTYKKNLSLFLIFAMILIAIYLTLNSQLHNQLLFSGIFSLLLYFLYFLDNQICNLSFLNAFQNIGVISYSLYLLHVPFQGRIINLGSRFIEFDSLEFLFLQILSWIIAIFVSYYFYKIIEKPLNEWRYKLDDYSFKVQQ